jgi:replicative DNA helicase
MSASFTAGAELFEEWKGEVTSEKPPTLFPVGDEGHPLNAVEIGPGQVVLVGAPPAAGKTALVMQMVFDAVRLTPTLKALVCNVEMSAGALLDRQLSRLAGIPLRSVRRRDVGGKYAEPFARGLIELKERAERVAFLRQPFDLANVARSADEFGADMILLDYVQRIGPPKEYADKRLSLNAVMDTVRAMADAGCAVLVVSAVGRQRDGNGKSSYDGLTLASFRESSELEYGADSAYLLVREPDSDDAVLKCVKNRHGEPADIDLTFDGAHQRFEPVEGRRGKVSAAVRGLWDDTGEGGDW